MRKRSIAVLAAMLTLSLTACGSTPDCGVLPPPTVEQKAASEQAVRGEGVEVEVELENDMGTTECVVEDGQWVDHTDADEAALPAPRGA